MSALLFLLYRSAPFLEKNLLYKLLNPILDTTQCRDSKNILVGLVPLIGLARPFNSSWRLNEHFCSMSLRMFDLFLTQWAHWVLFCIHTLCQISGVHWHNKNADVSHIRACVVLRGSSRLVTWHKIQRYYIFTSRKYYENKLF